MQRLRCRGGTLRLRSRMWVADSVFDVEDHSSDPVHILCCSWPDVWLLRKHRQCPLCCGEGGDYGEWHLEGRQALCLVGRSRGAAGRGRCRLEHVAEAEVAKVSNGPPFLFHCLMKPSRMQEMSMVRCW